MVTLFTETCTPLVLINGEVMCSSSPVIVGQECEVICNDRYTPDQSTVICQTGDMWSATPVCQGEYAHFVSRFIKQEIIIPGLMVNLCCSLYLQKHVLLWC